ncbi:MAG: twin-arginine translocase TatA/TatE family subunit, partial [Coriobacteriales bacterium]|nr:twin-arginine translocase TatA/TatE family subunit [Coriobacteriales bacterium]
MFGIGETELVIIVVFAFLLFGPDKMPGMGRTLGRMLRQFREASDGITEVVQTNIMDPASEELEKSPKQRAREAAAQLEE